MSAKERPFAQSPKVASDKKKEVGYSPYSEGVGEEEKVVGKGRLNRPGGGRASVERATGRGKGHLLFSSFHLKRGDGGAGPTQESCSTSLLGKTGRETFSSSRSGMGDELDGRKKRHYRLLNQGKNASGQERIGGDDPR